MFVQVIKGRTENPEDVRRIHERWVAEVKPGAKGYVGGTVGAADDGTFFAVARFTDEAAARANSDRPEQDAWYQEASKVFVGEPTFRESSDITTLFDGGSNDAGFVQVMEGTIKDRAKAEAFETPEMMAELRAARPDLIGSLRIWLDGGQFVDVAYFTSEADARKGETSEEFAGQQQEYMSLFGDMTFTDLRQPLLD